MWPATQANSASYPLWDDKWVRCGDTLRLGVKAGWLISFVDIRVCVCVWHMYNCVIPLTRPEHFRGEFHNSALYKSTPLNLIERLEICRRLPTVGVLHPNFPKPPVPTPLPINDAWRSMHTLLLLLLLLLKCSKWQWWWFGCGSWTWWMAAV